jgi:PPOX class probable F420-dependent enzyme
MTYRSVEELGDLLDLPINAVLATRREDDSVLLSPVWFDWREGGFDVGVPHGDPKLRHIARDPRVSIVVFENGGVGRGLEVTGTATVSEDEGRVVGRRLSIKYLGEEEGARYADALGPGTHVRVEGRIRAWDYADLEY